jgi:hypothetical protein
MKLKPNVLWIFLLAFFIISCENLDFQHPGDKYYYYPEKNVYYDINRSNFLYSLDSGKTWDSLYSEKPAPAIVGKREIVYNTTGEVWKDNEAHRRLYNGTALNIINDESLKAPAPAAKKMTAKNTSKSINEPEKKERKRPIKRFFQKLFGKKKPDTDK